MTYDEFWKKDYRLVESYTQRHGREIDYNAQLMFEAYGYISSLIMWKAWSESDPKKRGKAPNLPTEFEPISERGKYLKKLEKEKQAALDGYLRDLRKSRTEK